MTYEIRIRETGQVVSDTQFRAMHQSVSFPAALDAATLSDFGADPVLSALAPDITETQILYRNGATQDGLGNWVQAWAVRELTAEEIAAKNASQNEALKTSIQVQIDQLERNSLENRGARELHLLIMEKEAEAVAAENPPTTVEAVLVSIPYYVKLKALDDQIKALRAQL